MFGRSSSRGLKLPVGGAVFEFPTPEDFAFALAGRAGVPGSRVTALVELGDESLRREAEAIRQVEQMFNDALDGSLRDVTSISPFLKEIDLSVISQDHDWRTIIAALNASPAALENFKKVALVKYVQYLAARRQTVTAIYASRRSADARPNGDGDASGGNKVRETAIFDVGELAESETAEFGRIPKGETVEIDLAQEGGRLELMLAKHRCSLHAKDKVVFIDDAGQPTTLRRGKNIVGRDAGCDVLINTTYRDVSRRHLIVDFDGDGVVKLTDISSHGTSVSPRLLENTSI